MATRLTEPQIASRLESLDGWSLVDGKLHFEHQFADFSEAWGFMSRVALAAESLSHHPEWFNVWATVRIDLATHDVDGISELDFELAAKINELVG
jgi:4a-hydroxytetrahydrobiopterin dehydratase